MVKGRFAPSSTSIYPNHNSAIDQINKNILLVLSHSYLGTSLNILIQLMKFVNYRKICDAMKLLLVFIIIIFVIKSKIYLIIVCN